MKCLWEGDLKSAECLAPTARSGTGGLEWAHCDFEERLREWMTAPAPQKKIILVRGFPGSGKKWLFHSLAARPILTWPNPDNGFRTVTESVEIRTLKDYKPLRDRWISQKIRGLRHDAWKKASKPSGYCSFTIMSWIQKENLMLLVSNDRTNKILFDDPKVLLLSQLCIHSESWDRIVVAYFTRIWIWISRS